MFQRRINKMNKKSQQKSIVISDTSGGELDINQSESDSEYEESSIVTENSNDLGDFMEGVDDDDENILETESDESTEISNQDKREKDEKLKPEKNVTFKIIDADARKKLRSSSKTKAKEKAKSKPVEIAESNKNETYGKRKITEEINKEDRSAKKRKTEKTSNGSSSLNIGGGAYVETNFKTLSMRTPFRVLYKDLTIVLQVDKVILCYDSKSIPKIHYIYSYKGNKSSNLKTISELIHKDKETGLQLDYKKNFSYLYEENKLTSIEHLIDRKIVTGKEILLQKFYPHPLDSSVGT